MRALRGATVCPLSQNLAALVWSPDGTALAWVDLDGGVGALRGGAVARWEAGSGNCLAWAPDNRRFATGGDDGKVSVWDATKGLLGTWEIGGSVNALVWGPTCVAIGVGKRVELRNEAGVPLGEPTKLPGSVSALVRDPARDGFIASAYGQAVAIPAGAGAVKTFDWKGSMLGAAPSPDGKLVALGCQDSSLVVWQRNLGGGPDGEPLRMGGYPGKVQHLAWGEGPSLITGGADALVVWSFAGRGPAGQDGVMLPGHAGRILAVQTARRGRLLVSMAEEGAVARVICWAWRRSWEPIASLQVPATTIALRADGRGFAVAGEALRLVEIPE